MNDVLLNFFIGGWEQLFNPLNTKVETLIELVNKQGLLIMALQDQIAALATKEDELLAAIDGERQEVKAGIDTLTSAVAQLQVRVAELVASAGTVDPVLSAKLDEEIARVGAAADAVKGIYVAPVAPVEPAAPVN